jgi:hypothetical protein
MKFEPSSVDFDINGCSTDFRVVSIGNGFYSMEVGWTSQPFKFTRSKKNNQLELHRLCESILPDYSADFQEKIKQTIEFLFQRSNLFAPK